MNRNIKYRVLGVMSGTSLDGIDLAICTFIKGEKWRFKIERSKTFKYSIYWIKTLKDLHKKDQKKITQTDIEYGKFIGEKINIFLKGEKIDFIACHGHTIFHQPEKKYTLQIGNGRIIAKVTKTITINDFRSLDISLNGQGAPLVPIGDLYLFPDYKYCVNLGGFANISIKKDKKITAFDICPVNIVLNSICSKLDVEYDNNGDIASGGRVIPEILQQLNKLNFYKELPPKSLSREWVEKNINPILNNLKPKDSLRTFCEHIAIQIGSLIQKDPVLFTGGGVFNSFLIQRIKHHSSSKIIIPNNTIINFKEALLFGFIGVLKVRNEVNCLQSVTGAERDNCGGVIHQF